MTDEADHERGWLRDEYDDHSTNYALFEDDAVVGALFDEYGPDGKATKWIRLFLVIDHRIIDGVYSGRIAHFIRGVFADPAKHFDK